MAGRRHRVLIRRFTGGAAILLAKALGSLPLPWARAVARAAAKPIYYAVPRIRRVGMSNLRRAFGDTLTDRDRKRILMEAVENMTIVAAEFPRTPDLVGDFLQANIEIEGDEHLPRDSGCIIVGAHLGNWEWLAPAMAGRGWKVAEVVRPLDDPRLDAYVDRTRRSGRILTIPKLRAANEMMARLKEGYVVGLLADQSPRRNGVPVRFFGQPCWATIGPVMLALRGHAPVFAVAMVRKPDGRYLLKLTQEIQFVKTGDLRTDLVENVQRCQDAIEAMVREYPGQWLWLHRRWKERPQLEQEWNARVERNADKTAGRD